MALLLISFIAGVLTVLAPCVLPLLPIIIGGAAQGTKKRSPFLITASLATSIVLFTLLLKFSTAFIDIPQETWSIISGVIIIVFGLISIFPSTWDRISLKLKLTAKSEELLAESAQKSSRWGDVLIGMSLGPVFSSCSPTYFLILATVLPRSLAEGTLYLIAYALGLSLVLFLVSLLGQKFTRGAAWAADPNGWFKKGLGILFLIVGVFILTGTDKKLQAYLLEKGYFNITNVEQKLLEKALPQEKTPDNKTVSMKNYPRYREIANPSGFVNTEPFQLADLIGKKVILVDFMTYSCINCIRTFPYLNDWNDKYKDQGLVIVGIHTPEFAFEKKRENVVEAMKKYGITFPVVMDNDYGTWNAYQNSYWPRKYLIDLDGNSVYDHIGEGQYEETEMKIQELLKVKAKVSDLDKSDVLNSRSPETYFGSARNRTLITSPTGVSGIANGVITKPLKLNALSLGGTWDIQSDFAVSSAMQSQIAYRFDASEVYFVAASAEGQDVEVLLDGKSLTEQQAGEDIFFRDGKSYLRVQEERLYSLFRSTGKNESHDLELIVPEAGLEAYTFTFG